MVVFALETASETIRGELTKWFLEIKPGVFVGNVNARVRDLLWERIGQTQDAKGAVLVFSANNEQGFDMRLAGLPTRSVVELDGIKLVKFQQL